MGTTGLPLTHLQESAYFWSPPNELRPGLPVVPSGRTVVHITSCRGARWYISLTTLSRRRRSKPLAVDHNWPFFSCVCAEDGSTRTTGRVLRRWLERRRKYTCRYTSENTYKIYKLIEVHNVLNIGKSLNISSAMILIFRVNVFKLIFKFKQT